MNRLLRALAFLLTSLGCGLIYQEPSSVAQGEYYASGNPTFDEFFIKLHRLQVELAGAPEGPRRIRADLARSLGLEADAADEQIGIRVSEEARKLAESGARLKLELPAGAPEQASPETSVTVRTSQAPSQSGETFVKGVQTAATQLLRMRNRMRVGQRELESLRVQGLEFDGQIDSAFHKESAWKREEVRENIADGQKLITLMIARSEEVATRADKLLGTVVRAATTDESLGRAASAPAETAPASTPASGEDETRDKPKSAKSRKKPAPKASRPSNKARPAALKPAPGSGHDERPPPAPKPPPSESAPKEFEP